MSEPKPLMPKATAAWLVETTALSFDQIADFCQMHLLEVKGIADGDVAMGIKGMDPIASGQLSRDEIAKAEKNPSSRLTLSVSKIEIPPVKSKRGPRYTPTSRRHERPNAVVWLIRNHPELKDSQIMRLVGTTKPTIQQVKERTHWNSQNLVPQDPVTLGLCSQIDLDAEVKKAAKRVVQPGESAGTLLPTSHTTAPQPDESALRESEERAQAAAAAEEEARMLANLRGMGGGDSKAGADDDHD